MCVVGRCREAGMPRKRVQRQERTRRVVECGESPLRTVVVLVSAMAAVLLSLLLVVVVVFLDVLWCLRGMSEMAAGHRLPRGAS